jgi:hypothetical protein
VTGEVRVRTALPADRDAVVDLILVVAEAWRGQANPC